MKSITQLQAAFLARIIEGLPSLIENTKGEGIGELKLGARKMPDGRIVEVFLTAKSRQPVSPAHTHGMKPPQ